MIIEGDNLEALKALLPQYENRIKCIYIDPPYNTGNEGWVYNDNVNDPRLKKWLGQAVGKEAEDLSRHDKWLCMMYPRLKLLHKLLANDGAIFISIDDNEQANLKLICDEIFGSGNFITTVTWFKKVSPSNDAKWFSNDHEFIFVYAKNKGKWYPNRLELNEKQLENYKNPDNDERGPWNSSTYTCNKTADERPNLYYPLENPFTGEMIFPKKTAVWAYSKDVYTKHKEENLIFWGVDGKAKMPRFKKFLSDSSGVVPRTIWHYNDSGHTQEATQVLRKILNTEQFNTPKPPRLIEKILKLSTNKDDIILDSFAGSGTTAHAVLNLNAADGGNRKFILVEMNDYAESITAERVRRAMQQKATPKPSEDQTQLFDNQENTNQNLSFSYYTLGEAIFDENENLNPKANINAIREYIWYSETKSNLTLNPSPIGEGLEKKGFLGVYNNTAYYFYYQPNQITTLNEAFLSQLSIKAEQYLIYADFCTLSDDFLSANNIIFKKIPRDITRV